MKSDLGCYKVCKSGCFSQGRFSMPDGGVVRGFCREPMRTLSAISNTQMYTRTKSRKSRTPLKPQVAEPAGKRPRRRSLRLLLLTGRAREDAWQRIVLIGLLKLDPWRSTV